MRRARFLATVFTAVVLFFCAAFLLLALERGVATAKLMIEKRLELRAAEELKLACSEIEKEINEAVREEAQRIFENIAESISGYAPETDEEAGEKYLKALEAYIRTSLEEPGKNVTSAINGLNARTAGTVVIGVRGRNLIRLKDPDTVTLSVVSDENGYITDSRIENVSLLYYRGFDVLAEQSFDIGIHIPRAVFFSGNDFLFEYSMLAGKGIYFTGRTSSVVGNIYAGTHDISEFRQAEARYGEKGVYGGINIASAQLGVEAESIISEGDINVKRSFVMLGLEERPVRVYARALNRLDGFDAIKDVTIDGELVLEPEGSDYESLLSSVDSAMSGLSLLSDHYDSDNDQSYEGTYRKILSNYDVVISGDFRGAIVTSGNVITEADANIEGLIMAGDRIYVQGNNNIVSNDEILRTIIDEELAEEEREDGKTEAEDDFAVSHRLKDYIGQVSRRGIK
ncbi:MAG TPA: hypothetical protein DCL38_00980 [Lachnospiraceae bacterium]|nr:hypothetical protein [Lachnospiraceae bacterium]